MEVAVPVILIGLGVCGIIAAVLADQKNAAAAGFWLGVLLGPLGILIAALALDYRERCPQCKEHVNASATLCPACRTALAWVDGKPYSSQDAARIHKEAEQHFQQIADPLFIHVRPPRDFTDEEVAAF